MLARGPCTTLKRVGSVLTKITYRSIGPVIEGLFVWS